MAVLKAARYAAIVISNQATTTNTAIHNHPYPSFPVGIGAGALLGYFAACGLKGGSG